MKWGERHEKGCNQSSCDKAHPVLCDRSHDLRCFVKNCPFKLHTQKCIRARHLQQTNTAGPSRGSQLIRNTHRIDSNSTVDVQQNSSNISPWIRNSSSYQNHHGQIQSFIRPDIRQDTSAVQQSHFQNLTVQQMLEAHLKVVQLELDRQRHENNSFQQRMQQQLIGYQGLVQ